MCFGKMLICMKYHLKDSQEEDVPYQARYKSSNRVSRYRHDREAPITANRGRRTVGQRDTFLSSIQRIN